MKRLVTGFLCLATVALLRAELPPSAYEKMQSKATEVFRVNVLRVDVTPTKDEAVQEVMVLAETLKVGRSQTKVKPGDMITVRYTVTTRPPGWVGPGEVPILKDNMETIAYLAPIPGAQEYAPAAGVMSFDRF